MKKVLIVTIILISISLFLSSCVSPVKISGKKEKVQNLKKVALIEFIITPHEKPSVPLIDAAIYNSNIDDIAAEIIQTNNQRIDTYETYLAERYREYFKNDILFGKELYGMNEYINLKDIIKIENVAYDDDDFPIIHIPKNAYNFFNFYDSDNPLYFFSTKKLEKEKGKIQTICNKLKVDGAIIAVTGIMPQSRSGFFTALWSRINMTKLFFFDKEGEFILFLRGDSEAFDGSADDIVNYRSTLDEYYSNIRLMFDVLFGLKENSR